MSLDSGTLSRPNSTRTRRPFWNNKLVQNRFPKKRLASYIAAVRGHGSYGRRIHQHFLETGHTADDMRFLLIDEIPPCCKALPSTFLALRLRLEREWRFRLSAVPNTKVDLWHFFPGASQARVGARHRAFLAHGFWCHTYCLVLLGSQQTHGSHCWARAVVRFPSFLRRMHIA